MAWSGGLTFLVTLQTIQSWQTALKAKDERGSQTLNGLLIQAIFKKSLMESTTNEPLY
jgi:hypothetical protein